MKLKRALLRMLLGEDVMAPKWRPPAVPAKMVPLVCYGCAHAQAVT